MQGESPLTFSHHPIAKQLVDTLSRGVVKFQWGTLRTNSTSKKKRSKIQGIRKEEKNEKKGVGTNFDIRQMNINTCLVDEVTFKERYRFYFVHLSLTILHEIFC